MIVWTIIIILVDKTNLIVKPEKMSYELVMQFRKCSVPRTHLPKRKRPGYKDLDMDIFDEMETKAQ